MFTLGESASDKISDLLNEVQRWKRHISYVNNKILKKKKIDKINKIIKWIYFNEMYMKFHFDCASFFDLTFNMNCFCDASIILK